MYIWLQSCILKEITALYKLHFFVCPPLNEAMIIVAYFFLEWLVPLKYHINPTHLLQMNSMDANSVHFAVT